LAEGKEAESKDLGDQMIFDGDVPPADGDVLENPSQSMVVPSGTPDSHTEAQLGCSLPQHQRIEEDQADFRHELANILTFIQLAIDMIRREIFAIRELEPVVDKRASMLDEHIQTLESSIREALTICERDRCKRKASSLPPAMAEEAEEAEMKLEKLNLSEILLAQIKLWRRVLRKDIDIRDEVNRGISINADKTLLTQIFTNVWFNSIQSMQAVPGRSNLMVVACSADDGMCTITIEDNGAGISSANENKLFKRGFTTKPTGSGIGLNLCRELAQKMGGSFELTNGSSMAEGATVTIRFPLADYQEPKSRRKRGWQQLNLDLGDSPRSY
jgi:signal transduction histidine kinase